MEKRRIHYFDIAKGIGMICVILGHLSIVQVNKIVFTFHMPLISSALSWLGKYSLVVLCCHLIELTFFPWNRLGETFLDSTVNGILVVCMMILGKVIWCVIGVYIVMKVPVLSSVFGISKRKMD